MEITRSTVPGVGAIHQFVTRDGVQFGIYLNDDGARELVLYGPDDRDTPLRRIMLASDEADQLAETLHSRALTERVSELERRVNRLTTKK
ncbi:hypothetical protein [Streptomyces oceani]|uniref:Potassium/proton antiporter subunit KhtT-like N-terminal domain-containing protein n=1 Tax=Streptomyces oceani TaxID=1075402 RepID=A0A1E7JTV7_9ACTN|nr:hypothetical protein [Streptomyces oceani]OEU93402.1 hypothetical protein AN216_24550 [Streptomyces oceani]